ncbi:MAG: Ppx/GppA phosphatase family protein [Pseudomonadota bacterium]
MAADNETPPKKRPWRNRRRNGRGVPHNQGSENASAAQPPHNSLKPVPPKDESAVRRPYAALDLGTNNCRLLVAHPLGRGFRVIDAFSRIVRLGDGISRTGSISDAAMDRAVDALKVCRDKLNNRNVGRRRLIATEACRIAENGEEFIDRVRNEAGLELEIIDQETEARLSVSGSASLIDRDADGVVVFDIGGGSTELSWLDLSKSRRRSPLSAHKRIVDWTSLPLGVVRLADEFGGVEVTEETYEAMVQATLNEIQGFKGGLMARDAMDAGRSIHLLGTSGTVTTLAGVKLGLKRYDRRKVDGVWIDRQSMQDMAKKVLGWTYEQRRENGCIGPDRADLVLPGCAILEAICRSWPCERLRVADRGLREGILTTMMAEDGVWRNAGRGRRRNRLPHVKSGAH